MEAPGVVEEEQARRDLGRLDQAVGVRRVRRDMKALALDQRVAANSAHNSMSHQSYVHYTGKVMPILWSMFMKLLYAALLWRHAVVCRLSASCNGPFSSFCPWSPLDTLNDP